MLFEQRMPGGHAGKRSTEWVARLSAVIAALNNKVTRLTDKKPADAIKAARVPQKPSSVVPGRPVGSSEQKIPSSVGVRNLYQPGELEGWPPSRNRPCVVPSECTDLCARSPSPESLPYIIFKMGQPAGSSGKSCL